jgi:hypothetical protein
VGLRIGWHIDRNHPISYDRWIGFKYIGLNYISLNIFFQFFNFPIFPGRSKNGQGFLGILGGLLKLVFCEKFEKNRKKLW